MEKNGNKREDPVRRSNDFQKSIELVLRVANASNDVRTHNTSVRNLPERLYVRVYETGEESYRVGSRTLARIRLRSIELCLGDDFGKRVEPDIYCLREEPRCRQFSNSTSPGIGKLRRGPTADGSSVTGVVPRTYRIRFSRTVARLCFDSRRDLERGRTNGSREDRGTLDRNLFVEETISRDRASFTLR